MKKRAFCKTGTTAAAALFVLGLCCAARAADRYPSKPINILVAFSPGGAADISSLVLTKPAEKLLGRPFVFSYNGGGGGTVAIGIVVKQKPDGYNLVACTATGLVRVPQYRAVPYKLDDLLPITSFCATQSGIAARSDSPFRTLKDLVEYARRNPGKVTYSTTGVGTPMHLAMEFIAKKEHISWTHVPYPGSMPSVTALLGGHVTAASTSTEWAPFVREWRLRLLATHGEKRMKMFPAVPTMRELGYDFINDTIFIIGGPKGMPEEIVRKLDDAFHKSMSDPGFIDALMKIEHEPVYRNSKDTQKFLRGAWVRYGRMIKGIKVPVELPQKK